jgi:hypothetical protein
MRNRQFTLEEADALLPWLEEQFTRMMPLRDELATRQEQLIDLLRRRRSNGHSSNEDDIVETQRAVDRLTKELQDQLQEVSRRGILVRDLGRGLVDFPSIRDGREVYLCWLRGEEQIGYWHDTNTGFAGRQPI